MTSARDRDLGRWERGELSMADLVALHGNDEAAGLVAVHRRMSALGTSPVGDPEAVWHAIRERLPAPVLRTVPLRRRLTRPLAIAAAAVLIAGTAYAGSPNVVQRYLTSFWHTVQSILDVDAPSKAPVDVGRPSRGGGQEDEPVAVVGDADHEDPNGDETNENEGGPGGNSTVGESGDEEADEGENGSGDDDAEGIGENDQGEDQDGDTDEVVENGDGPSGDENDPSDEDDPGSGGDHDEADHDGPGGGDHEGD